MDRVKIVCEIAATLTNTPANFALLVGLVKWMETGVAEHDVLRHFSSLQHTSQQPLPFDAHDHHHPPAPVSPRASAHHDVLHHHEHHFLLHGGHHHESALHKPRYLSGDQVRITDKLSERYSDVCTVVSSHFTGHHWDYHLEGVPHPVMEKYLALHRRLDTAA
jgi:hypothetical protein